MNTPIDELALQKAKEALEVARAALHLAKQAVALSENVSTETTAAIAEVESRAAQLEARLRALSGTACGADADMDLRITALETRVLRSTKDAQKTGQYVQIAIAVLGVLAHYLSTKFGLVLP